MEITLSVRGARADSAPRYTLPRTHSGVRPWTPENMKQFTVIDGKSLALSSPVQRPPNLSTTVCPAHACLPRCKCSRFSEGTRSALFPTSDAHWRPLSSYTHEYTRQNVMKSRTGVRSKSASAPLVPVTPLQTMVNSIPEFVPTKIGDYRPTPLRKAYGERTICERVATSKHLSA